MLDPKRHPKIGLEGFIAIASGTTTTQTYKPVGRFGSPTPEYPLLLSWLSILLAWKMSGGGTLQCHAVRMGTTDQVCGLMALTHSSV